MNRYPTRSNRWALRPAQARSCGCGLAAACGLLAMLAVHMPARGQCSQAEQAEFVASDATGEAFFGNSVAVSVRP